MVRIIISEILAFQIIDFEKVGQGHDTQLRNGAIRREIYDLEATTMCVPFITLYEIFAKQSKCQKFDLENEDQSQGGEKRVVFFSTGNVRYCR